MTTSPTQRNNRTRLFAGVLFGIALIGTPATAVPIADDPHGFETLPWGTTLLNVEEFVKIEDDGRSQIYERKEQPPMLGNTPVDSLRFTTFAGKFGRVTVRYSGNAAHERILAYLQATYGPLDRTPGQIAVGPVKVYAWHGFDTEVTLRFEAKLGRGVIFFESRALREALTDGTSATTF
jgi:hypothetical protein